MSRDIVRPRLVALFGMLLAVSFGCGDFATSETDGNGPRKNAAESQDFVLVAGGPKQIDVGVGGRAELKVFVYKKSTGDPVEGKAVQFSVRDGASRGSLSAKSAVTGQDGAASAMFRAGMSAGSAKVRVSHKGLEPVTFTLEVTEQPTGALEVTPTHTAPSLMGLSDIEVRVYEESQLTCGGFRALADEQPDPFRHAGRDAPGKEIVFNQMGIGEEYTVTGTARGEYDQIAAGGCIDGVQLAPNETSERELLMQLIPLEPAGRYRAVSHWDFSKALEESGVIGETIASVLDVFENPGEGLYNEIIDLVSSFLGDLAGKSIEWIAGQLGLDDQFKQMINDAVQNNEALCKVREAGRDLKDVVEELEVVSNLTIGKLGSDYEFQGRSTWQAVSIYWRGKCDDAYETACSGSEDDSDPADRRRDCAEIKIEAGEDDSLAEFGVLSTEWTGRVTSYDQLRINRHAIPLEYGKFLDWLLAEHILPDLTGGKASSLAEAFGHWIGCDSLADTVTGSNDEICVPSPIDQCITQSKLQGMCSSAVSTVFGFADLLLRQLKFDTGISVGGEAVLVETTSDAKVDRIEEGTYEGSIEVNGEGSKQGQSSITADWSAERIESDSD